MPRGPGLLASQAQDQNRQRIGGLLGLQQPEGM